MLKAEGLGGGRDEEQRGEDSDTYQILSFNRVCPVAAVCGAVGLEGWTARLR